MAFFRPERASDCAMQKLQELCLYKIVDNLDLLGDVGDTPAIFLQRILAHCTLDQLKRIEDASQGRDLESITNEFWHRFYQKKWGAEATAIIEDKVQKKSLPLRWRALYEHKVRQEEQIQAKCVSRLRELFIKEKNEKQSRTVQVCARRPEVKRRLGASQSPSIVQRGRLLAKAKKEYVGSFDAQRRKSIQQRPPSVVQSALGKRPAPALTPSTGPVFKRPALGSPQIQAHSRHAGTPTRPEVLQTEKRSLLGKRPSEAVAVSARKRLALGGSQTGVGSLHSPVGTKSAAPGKAGSGPVGRGLGTAGVGVSDRGISDVSVRREVGAVTGSPGTVPRGSSGTRGFMVETSGNDRGPVKGAGKAAGLSGSGEKRDSESGASTRNGRQSSRDRPHAAARSGSDLRAQTEMFHHDQGARQRVKDPAADAAERRASTGTGEGVGSTGRSRGGLGPGRDQPAQFRKQAQPAKLGSNNVVIGGVVTGGESISARRVEHQNAGMLVDDEALWDE